MKAPYAAAVALLLMTGEAAAAGDRVDVSRGEALARKSCTECHVVGRGELVGPYAEVPSFAAVARLPSTTEMSIRVFLRTPHPNMPNIKLTPKETDDVVAYILSLKPP